MSRRQPPPHLYFLGSAVFHYLGPAFAVLLFARVDVLGVAWLRIASAAAIFAVWRRPWRTFRELDRDGRRLLVAWGAVLAVMNCCFYTAIDRLPLGTVATIEFLPVIALAALGARTPRNVAALALAVPGVYLITGVRLEGEPVGVAFAFANAILFALYIVLAHRVSRHQRVGGIDGLAASMLIAAVAVTPIAGWQVVPVALDPVALLAGVGVGVSSSVIPYVFDQLAMARLSRATYALMVALLPATATVIGVAVLGQVPSPAEVAGVLLVIAGVAVHRDVEAAAAPPRAPGTKGGSVPPVLVHGDEDPPAGGPGQGVGLGEHRLGGEARECSAVGPVYPAGPDRDGVPIAACRPRHAPPVGRPHQVVPHGQHGAGLAPPARWRPDAEARRVALEEEDSHPARGPAPGPTERRLYDRSLTAPIRPSHHELGPPGETDEEQPATVRRQADVPPVRDDQTGRPATAAHPPDPPGRPSGALVVDRAPVRGPRRSPGDVSAC